jgi:EAL domain-containing protein (putative c-di-GMP-specific phosphodiesterase class I)
MSEEEKEKIVASIKNAEVYPNYQPILDTSDWHIRKCEVLARLKIDGEDVDTEEFIELAKKNNCYTEITKTIIKKSFAYLKNIDGLDSFSINMNLIDINDKEIKAYLQDEILANNLANKVIIELTEDEELAKEKEKVIDFIKEMSQDKFGCRFALDDFGKGYATFEPLISFNFNFIKLDTVLIEKMHKNPKQYYLVDMLADMSKRLNLKLVAEHVDEEEFKYLKELNIDYMQGYYIGRPSDIVKICKFY